MPILQGKAKIGIFDKLMKMPVYRSHVCPWCASYVIPYSDGTNNAHCAKCGPVVSVSMIETDVPVFREWVKNNA